MIRVTDPFTGVVEYGYDLVGNRTAMTVTGNQQPVTSLYTFDADNRLIQVTDWATGTTTYGYDTAGRLIITTLPNGVQTTHSYDDAGRLTALLHARGTTVLARYAYTLDAVGNRTHVTETVSGVTRGISYTYDALYRLTAAGYSTGETYAYQYDAVGNREVMTDTAVHTYAYDPANRLTNADDVLYTWDGRGNLLSDGTFTYTYNSAGRMARAESLTATLVYTYNADGLRVAQAVDGDVNVFTWDWATGVPELLSDGESTYLIGYDTLGWQTGSDWRFVLPDALGSVRQETDADGGVTAAREWSPFGEEVGEEQTGLGFTGEWFDAGVGMIYLRARWYDSATGRFTQIDPWERNSQQPLTLNDYLYVLAQPINGTDPSGELCFSCGEKYWNVYVLYTYGIQLDESEFTFSDYETSLIVEVVVDYANLLNTTTSDWQLNVELHTIKKQWARDYDNVSWPKCIPGLGCKSVPTTEYQLQSLDGYIYLPPHWVEDVTVPDPNCEEKTITLSESAASIARIMHLPFNPFDSREEAAKFTLAHEIGHAFKSKNEGAFTSFKTTVASDGQYQSSLLYQRALLHSGKPDYDAEVFADVPAAYLYERTMLSTSMLDWVRNVLPTLVKPTK